MPFEHTWGHRTLYKRFFGPTTVREFMLSVELTQGDARFDQLLFSVNDFTEATLPTLTKEDVTLFGALGIGAAFSNRKICIAVITSDPHAAAMALKYAEIAPFKLVVLGSRVELNQWLPEAHRVTAPVPG
ncbi:MAG: hypothetical protein K2W33_18370 [Burkholderiales bacterium]|nr:hypothetical protein [Burkholderiales bacterium]